MSTHSMQRALVTNDPTTGRYGHVGGRRWLFQIGPELHLVTTDEELRDLAQRARLTPDTPIYKVGAPQPLVDVPELSVLLMEGSESEPPVRLDRRLHERAQLSEELAILNRPLVDDVEYYEALPRSGFRRAVGVLTVLALIAGGGYFALRFSPRLDEVVRASLSTIRASAAEPAPLRAPLPASPPAAAPSTSAAATPKGEPEPPAPVAAPPEADPPASSSTAPRASAARPDHGGAHHHSRHRAR
jgi:hypothetical protein